MHRRNVRRKVEEGLLHAVVVLPIMPGRWWNRMRTPVRCRAEPMLGCAEVMAPVGSVPIKVGTYQSGS
ncbi:TPA: hypothetical protein ACGY72_002251 [Stenotrophomonas maltophilia]